MCHSTQIGFSGYCCSEKAHAKSSVGGEWMLPTVRFGMEWKRMKESDARVLFPDAFADVPAMPTMQITNKGIAPSALASGKLPPPKRSATGVVSARRKKRTKRGGILARMHRTLQEKLKELITRVERGGT